MTTQSFVKVRAGPESAHPNTGGHFAPHLTPQVLQLFAKCLFSNTMLVLTTAKQLFFCKRLSYYFIIISAGLTETLKLSPSQLRILNKTCHERAHDKTCHERAHDKKCHERAHDKTSHEGAHDKKCHERAHDKTSHEGAHCSVLMIFFT